MADELIPLKISPGILSDIYREARGAFPAECCGWLSGPKDGDEVKFISYTGDVFTVGQLLGL